jgi:hypothetical protein
VELGRADRLEEHEDPTHPVIALATRRIEELSTRRDAVSARIKELEQTNVPAAPKPEAIEKLLEAVPDFRPFIERATPEDLRELLSALDFGATYDKKRRSLHLTAVLTDKLVHDVESRTTNRNRWGISFIAGAGFEPATSGL